MGFMAIVDKSVNRTQANTELYIRIHRIDYFSKWRILRISVTGYATYESGLKMKLSEDYYNTLLGQSLDPALASFAASHDARDITMANTLPGSMPGNEPEALFSQSYNMRVPDGIDITDNAQLYPYIYDCIKTDSVYSEVEDILVDPSLEEIATY
jgi:hypothetical protein